MATSDPQNKEEFSFEEQNSLTEEQEDKNSKSINNQSAKQSFAPVQNIQIQKVEAITLQSLIEGIKLKLSPEDYVKQKNRDDLKLTENIYVFKVLMNDQEWKQAVTSITL